MEAQRMSATSAQGLPALPNEMILMILESAMNDYDNFNVLHLNKTWSHLLQQRLSKQTVIFKTSQMDDVSSVNEFDVIRMIDGQAHECERPLRLEYLTQEHERCHEIDESFNITSYYGKWPLKSFGRIEVQIEPPEPSRHQLTELARLWRMNTQLQHFFNSLSPHHQPRKLDLMFNTGPNVGEEFCRWFDREGTLSSESLFHLGLTTPFPTLQYDFQMACLPFFRRRFCQIYLSTTSTADLEEPTDFVRIFRLATAQSHTIIMKQLQPSRVRRFPFDPFSSACHDSITARCEAAIDLVDAPLQRCARLMRTGHDRPSYLSRMSNIHRGLYASAKGSNWTTAIRADLRDYHQQLVERWRTAVAYLHVAEPHYDLRNHSCNPDPSCQCEMPAIGWAEGIINDQSSSVWRPICACASRSVYNQFIANAKDYHKMYDAYLLGILDPLRTNSINNALMSTTRAGFTCINDETQVDFGISEYRDQLPNLCRAALFRFGHSMASGGDVEAAKWNQRRRKDESDGSYTYWGKRSPSQEHFGRYNKGVPPILGEPWTMCKKRSSKEIS